MATSRPRRQLTKEEVEDISNVYRDTAPDLERCARARLADRPSEVADVLQTTFTDMVDAWPRVRELGPEGRRRWLFRVLGNKIIDLLRKRTADELPPDLPSRDFRCGDPAEQVDYDMTIAAGLGVISRMPKRRRQVTERWVGGFTNAQIAEQLGMAQSTVRGHLAPALEQLEAVAGHRVRLVDRPEGEESS